MITQYLYFLIFLTLTIHIHAIINFQKDILQNSKLAFNINIIYISKPINKYRSIKKIQLEDFNSIFLKKFLLKNKFLLNISHIDSRYIVNRIESLKSYGFLAKVKLSFIPAHDKKYITLNFKINPVLKRIKISKQKTLLIPNNLLINTFQKQIGLPQNYIDINKSIQIITLWYKSRGFDWANVELIKTKKAEEIYFKVFEGQIATCHIICKQKSILSHYRRCNIENEIKHKLGIIPGCILNTKKMELGIIELKHNKLIDNCKYTIHKNSYGLNVFFKYDLFKSDQAFFFQQETIVDYYKQMIKICRYYLYSTKLISKSHKKQKSTYSKKQIIILNYFVKSMIWQVKKKINLGIEPLFKHFGFKYFSYPQNKSQQSFILDMQIIRKNTYINVSFLYPNKKLNNGLLDYIILNFHYKYYTYNVLNYLQTLYLLNLYKTNRNSVQTKIKSFGFDILLRKYIYEYIYLTEQLINQFNTSNQRLINIYTYYQSKNKTKNIKLVPITLQRISKIIKENLMILKIKIKYNTFYLTQQLKSGKLLIIESIYVIPFSIKQPYVIHAIEHASQSLHIKYNQVYVLPKIIKFSYDNVLIFLAEIDWFVSEQKHNPIFQTNDTNLCFKNYNRKYNAFRPSFLYHIEYNLALSNYLSFYIFCNFAHNLNLYNKISLLNFNKYYIFNSSSYYDINIGSGIQFNIPIKKIPTLRIEYKISNNTNNFLQLRVYSQYND